MVKSIKKSYSRLSYTNGVKPYKLIPSQLLIKEISLLDVHKF